MKSFHLMKADKSASEIDRSAFFFKIHEKKLDKGVVLWYISQARP